MPSVHGVCVDDPFVGTACPGSASIQKVELFADSNGLYVPAGHGVSDVEPGEST
ncbi:MAG: hypothetical protein VX660_01985 [Candidatus Thermoplasmatota archaeon]|nr:hypothetical protein [Candidatus Thermoplasmatota archaeon]